jgi:hypothetical protein
VGGDEEEGNGWNLAFVNLKKSLSSSSISKSKQKTLIRKAGNT